MTRAGDSVTFYDALPKFLRPRCLSLTISDVVLALLTHRHKLGIVANSDDRVNRDIEYLKIGNHEITYIHQFHSANFTENRAEFGGARHSSSRVCVG